MDRAGNVSSRALTMAGRDIRRTLRKHYGSPEAAEEAIRALAGDVEAMEHWASVVTARDEEEHAPAFRFADIPAPMREVAQQSIASAMLAYTAKLEKRR